MSMATQQEQEQRQQNWDALQTYKKAAEDSRLGEFEFPVVFRDWLVFTPLDCLHLVDLELFDEEVLAALKSGDTDAEALLEKLVVRAPRLAWDSVEAAVVKEFGDYADDFCAVLIDPSIGWESFDDGAALEDILHSYAWDELAEGCDCFDEVLDIPCWREKHE